MTIGEYRKLKGMTQPELAKELQDIAPGIDAPLISKMEKGLCEPNDAVKLYIETQEANQRDMEFNLSQLQMDILEALANADSGRRVTRHELVILTGKSDRLCRREIENLRCQGLRICSDSKAPGYWIAKSESEYRRARGQYIARIKSCAHTLKAMDSFVEGQIRIQ